MTTGVKITNIGPTNRVKVTLVNPQDRKADSLAPPRTLDVGAGETFYVYDAQGIEVEEIAVGGDAAQDRPVADKAGAVGETTQDA